jgi:uncharacterized protein (DUF1501 family)
MDRRTLFKAALAACSSLPAITFANPAAGDRLTVDPLTPTAAARPLLIVVYLKGGNDGYSSIVPYADPLYRTLRPTLAVAREAVIPIHASHGFNAALAALTKTWDAKELALIQGVGFPQPEQQHDPDAATLFTAGAGVHADGWLSRALSVSARVSTAASIDAVAFGDLDIRAHDPMGPFRGQKLRVAQLQYPSEWLQAGRTLDTCTHEVTPALVGAARKLALPVHPADSTIAGADEWLAGCEAAVRLAAYTDCPPVIHLTLNALDGDHHHAFDTHENQARYNADAQARLARGLARLRQGLKDNARWQDTVIMTVDEFGRSPVENEKRGTHHGSANTQFVMGGRVKGGLYGQAPALIKNHSIGGVAPVIDYRELFTTMIEGVLRRDASGVFDRRYPTLPILKA